MAWALWLRPLPYADAERLVAIEELREDGPAGVRHPTIHAWREQAAGVDGIVAIEQFPRGVNLVGRGSPERGGRVYSVAAHVAVQRRYELGVRLALGATARQLFALVVRQALRPVLIGAVLGIGAALASGGLLGSFLFEIGPTDPGAFGAATVLLLVSPCSPAIFRRAAPRKRTRS